MISLFNAEEEREKNNLPTTNLDFSFGRCKTEKLQEQMTVEKAATILQIPTGRSGHVSDRHVLDKKFMNLLHKRHRIASNDPDYERKIENRHVLEVLIHESYQYMTKNGRWKGSVQEDKDDNRTTVALKTDERAKTRAKNKEGTKAEPKVDEQKKKPKKNMKREKDLNGSTSPPSTGHDPHFEWDEVPRTKSGFDLRRAIVRQEELERSRNILVKRMIDNYLTEEEDPVLNPLTKDPKPKPRIALLD